MGSFAAAPRILLVDDQPGDRDLLWRAASRAGGEPLVDDEPDPDRAVERAMYGGYDCIVVAPARGGVALIGALRAAGVAAPILLIHDHPDDAVEQAATVAGVTEVVGRAQLGPAGLARRLATAIGVGRAEAELARMHAERLTARGSRDDLLSIVAHDLRSPLNAIGLACEALEGELSTEDRLRYVAAIRRAGLRAERLLRDVVDISRIENGGLRLERRLVSPRGVVEQARAIHEPLARDAGAELRLDLPADPGQMFADTERVQQVLANLIGNALRHAKGSPITLEVRGDDDAVELAVVDRGPGIAAEALPHLFDRFYPGRGQRGGAGLGLAIARGIVDAHGGTISATSEPGQGTRIALRIPRKGGAGGPMASGAGAR